MGAVRVNPVTPQVKSETTSTMTVSLTANTMKKISFSPTNCNSSNYVGKQLVRAWPVSTWTNANVHVADNNAIDTSWNQFAVVSPSTQSYVLAAKFYYLE